MEGDGSPLSLEVEAALDPCMYAQAVVNEWVAGQGEVFFKETEGAMEAIIEDWGVKDGPTDP